MGDLVQEGLVVGEEVVPEVTVVRKELALDVWLVHVGEGLWKCVSRGTAGGWERRSGGRERAGRCW